MIVRDKSGVTTEVRMVLDPNEKFLEHRPDIELAKGEWVTIKLPSGAMVILTVSIGESVIVYRDPERNPLATLEITDWDSGG